MNKLLFICLALFAQSVFAADFNKPHRHQGIVSKFEGEPPHVELTSQDQSKLEKGERVMKQVEQKDGGRGVAVFRVAAPVDTVWTVIRDFNHYPEWVDGVKSTEIYKQDKDQIYVKFIIGALGVNYEYYIHHNYPSTQDWGTWTLDYSKDSDLDDSVGYWRVDPVADKPGTSQIEYSVDVRLKGWVPGFIKNLLVNRGLKQATVWVKEQAEKKQLVTATTH
jgi:uncharacterized membrane protein